VVEGASLAVSGALPGAVVTTSVTLRTEVGRAFTWATRAVADGSGRVVVRVPYATGLNGTTLAGRYVVSDGVHDRAVPVTADEVATGGRVPVPLSG
jgi:hypothetical protein